MQVEKKRKKKKRFRKNLTDKCASHAHTPVKGKEKGKKVVKINVLLVGVASKQKTRTMSAFLGGEGGGGLKFQKTRTFWGFFFLENFFLHWGCTRF